MTDNDRDVLLDWAKQIDRPDHRRWAILLIATLAAFVLGSTFGC